MLVTSDYDGTMAPLVSDPLKAFPHPESVHAMRGLANLASTTAAVISGRALRDLATLSRLPAEVQLVGSHGSEFDIGFIHAIDADAKRLLHDISEEMSTVAADLDGVTVEVKPASAALHVRNASPEDAQRVLDAIRAGIAQRDGVEVTEGKSVIELAVIVTDKGVALDILRHQESATAAVFFGDDVTDEKAFARLHGPDIGVKVGTGDSAAGFRLETTEQVSLALAFLLQERRQWLSGADAPPIERLTMLASPNSVALVTPDANMTWLCHPEPDSAAIFAHLLGGDQAGHFSVGPTRAALPLSQRYVDGTMTVQTKWSSLQVTDYLPHDVPGGQTSLTRVISGTATAVVSFAPRPEFGNIRVRLEPEADGIRIYGTADPMVLRSPGVQWNIVSDGIQETAHAEVDPSQGPVILELRLGADDLGPSAVPEPERRAESESYWKDWADRLTLPPLKPDLMKRSALTLRGLVHADSGSIMAAATTSLPEEIGGVRNWDYRYCWLRDAALTASALVNVGSTVEAENYLSWVHGVLESVSGPERLHPLYTLWGLGLPPEAVIDELPGYAGSRPVRVGNAANQQVQLDVFGPIVDLISSLAHNRRARGRRGKEALSDDDWSLVRAMVEAVERRWSEPDHGIWGNPRQPPPPRVLQGDGLDDHRPRPHSGAQVRPRDRTLLGDTAFDDPCRGARAGLERRGAVLHRRLRRNRSRRRNPAHRTLRTHRPVRSAFRRDRDGHRARTAQRDDGVPVPPRRRPPRRRRRIPPVCRMARRGVPTDRPALRGRGTVRATGGRSRADRSAQRGIRSSRRAISRQPPAGLQPPRTAAMCSVAELLRFLPSSLLLLSA